MQALLILTTVGILIGSWVAGAILSMIYYGLIIMNPAIFLFAGCVLCCIISLATGILGYCGNHRRSSSA